MSEIPHEATINVFNITAQKVRFMYNEWSYCVEIQFGRYTYQSLDSVYLCMLKTYNFTELLSETLCVNVLHAQTSSIYPHHNWQTISINTLVVV